MNDQNPVTEGELKARAVAPRVTKELFDENIACVNFINAGDAICKSNPPDHESHHLLTICVIVLKNGFTVTGESACASPENYQKDIGERIALERAKEKIWPLMGYALRDHLAYGGQSFWAQPAERQASCNTCGDTKRVHVVAGTCNPAYDTDCPVCVGTPVQAGPL